MNINVHALVAALSCSLFGGCAVLQPLPTPTGRPEVLVRTGDATKIKSALIANLNTVGYCMVQDTQFGLVFSKPLDGPSAVLYQAMLGNSTSSTPQIEISFNFAPEGKETRVFAHINTAMQNAFGRVDRSNMDYGRAAHEVQSLLENVKVAMEPRRN